MLLSCIALLSVLVNTSQAAMPATNQPTNKPTHKPTNLRTNQPTHPQLTNIADRTMQMQFENWDWDSGVAIYGMMRAWQATGDQRYFDFAQTWVDGFIERGLPPITHPNHTTPGLATLMLYETSGHEKYLVAAQQMAEFLLNDASRTAEGALYHYEDQLWVDTVFVSAPFLSRFGQLTGDTRYTDEAVRQFRLHAERLQDPDTGLFYHGWDESEDSHMSGAFWLRGNGWAMAAGTDLLDQLAADHPARPEIRNALLQQADGLRDLQDRSGLWHTVIDQPDFYTETSGTAAIGYALLRGLDQGWLKPARFSGVAQQARGAVVDKVNWDGTVLDVSTGTGVLPNLADYNAIPHGAIQPWGQGLALLFLSQRSYGFQLMTSPSKVLASPGETTRAVVATAEVYGSLPEIEFGLTGAPDSVAWSFSGVDSGPRFVAGLDARLTLTATAGTPIGNHPLTVSATTEDLTRAAGLTLQVATQTYGVYLPLVGRQHDDQPNPVRLTDGPADDWQPTLFSDGRLAFISDRSGESRVYVQESGNLPQRIGVWNSLEEDRPLFAEDGRLAFSARSPHSNWDAVIYGDRPQIWFPVRQPNTNELHPAISPDGDFMTYVSDQSGNWEIYVIELRRLDPQLTFHVASDRVPVWAPGGEEIVFRSEWQGNSDVYAMDAEGGELRRLTHDPASDAWPRVSPGGRWILFQSDRSGNNDIYVMNREGGRVTPVVTHPAEDLTPAWSPDGKHVLFASDRDGDLEIYQQPFSPPAPQVLFPNYPLAEKTWRAVERFVEAHPPEDIYPGYPPAAGGPSAENVRANIEASCHDFPDLPDLFGEGAHHRACYEWVAAYLGLYHASSAWRSGSSEDVAWAQHYLDAEMDYLAEFVYGPEDSPSGASYRDTLAAIWQNPIRAKTTGLIADLLRERGALGSERRARVEELLSGVARAWYAEYWETGQHPNPGTPFTTRKAPEAEAYSLAGHPVMPTMSWTFQWDADEGNTNAEETAWMGGGIMVAARILGDRMLDADDIYEAARHYADFAISYDRPDPVHGDTIRTLNSETTGGAYGQRRYWIENHAADMPSIPYVGFTWQFLGSALFASDLGDQQPWPSFVPDATQWDVLLRSAGETMRAADGTFLVDYTPGQGIGFNLDNFPAWVMPCGQGQAGKQYVRYDGRAGGPEIYVSEIGHPAGLDLAAAGWPLMRIAADRGDEASYGVWEGRVNRILDEYIANPPNPGWATCKTGVYVSTNPGYHWSRMLSVYMLTYLGASGYDVDVWD